eukprot:1429549-Prymnesium_polylepis.2
MGSSARDVARGRDTHAGMRAGGGRRPRGARRGKGAVSVSRLIHEAFDRPLLGRGLEGVLCRLGGLVAVEEVQLLRAGRRAARRGRGGGL